MAVLGESGNTYQLSTSPDDDMRVLLLAGQPIREPIAKYGPIVMNTMEEIQQAFRDYQNGHFGKIAGAEERYAKTDAAVKQSKQTGNWNKHKEL